MCAQLLKLGYVDQSTPGSVMDAYFTPYHGHDMPLKRKFRGDRNFHWIGFQRIQADHVKKLQTFLKEAGFQPHGDINGIFGYRTISGVRLFQEYIRTIEGDPSIGIPDGVVGPKTHFHIDRWQSAGKEAIWKEDTDQQSDEFKKWIEVLNKLKARFLSESTPTLQAVMDYNGPSDTLAVKDWDFDPGGIHLIGIRRLEWLQTQTRANDDLLILLINGMVFKFFGSTDPNPSMAGRRDTPFLVHGQHKYRFGWHKLSELDKKVYRALKPKSNGVLVCRDRNVDRSLTLEDLRHGLTPNNSINVHWSGTGTSNWSAGCQVICGRSYMNNLNKIIDCTPFSAANYTELDTKTRGAYSVASDLITVFARRGEEAALYTLLYEEDLNSLFESDYTSRLVDSLSNLG
jgi:hypothetical protein